MKRTIMLLTALLLSLSFLTGFAFPATRESAAVESLLEAEPAAPPGEPETADEPGSKPLEGYTIILHTNDMHGHAVADDSSLGYSGIAGIRKNLQELGAFVLLMDAGDFIQGTPLVNMSKGETAIEFMNAAGYDIAVPGNHEYDWDAENLTRILEKAEFKVVCADIFDEVSRDCKFRPNATFETPDGFKIGVFGIDTPESMTKANPDKLRGLYIPQGEELYSCIQSQVDALKADGCDLIVCLGHLGIADESAPNRSTDAIRNVTGIDLLIDGHSHTVEGEQDENTLLVSTGCYGRALGYVVYVPETDQTGTKKLTMQRYGLYDLESRFQTLLGSGYEIRTDPVVEALVDGVNDEVDRKLSEVFAKTEVLLNGERNPGNRTEETNLGDFSTDAILWAARQSTGQDVACALMNGGAIRASIPAGDITMKTIKTVYPFSNTVCTLVLKGSEILEALEAATFSLPDQMGAFPQVSGIEYTVDTTVPWIPGSPYPGSTYSAPKKPGKRVKIQSIGGEPFNPKKEYILATNDFVAAGGDTYYAFKYAGQTAKTDTGVMLEDALIEFIRTVLDGTIGQKYAEPQGRITILR